MRAAAWLKHRRANYVLLLLVIVLWSSVALAYFRALVFWVAPLTSSFLLLLLLRVINNLVLDRKWRALDMIRLAFWGSIHPFVTVVLLAMGFEGAIERKWSAVIWFLGSAIAAVVGPVRLRAAQGFSWRKVKSGTLYVRALHLARKMGVSVRWVYVIPPGRGILTNAFATLRGVALTDNFGEFLHGPQLDFVIAHELAHNKNKHFRKQFLSLLLVVLSLSVMSWALASLIGPHESVFLLGFLLTILLSYFAISRRFEYEADRDAALLVGSPQPGIRALAALYRKTGTPIEEGLLLELFMSHPSFANRTSALARVFGVPGVPGTTSANTGISDGAPLPQPE
jgi:Zn-dependent protease with chaperone function